MDQNEDSTSAKKGGKVHNVLPFHGNESTMNLNPLILANIQGSSYFKVSLFKLKTYHEVVDEIYYQVKHLEPWERGSRKTSGQTGMCGGVRGVGAGGIVSTAFCLLYKLYTLRLTRKQVNGLMTHTDSPYIRALGFMYIRYTQPPGDLYDWYEEYLQDEEEVDVKAGGGQVVTIGHMLYQWLTKLDWFSTLFPRIPVPIQKQIERKLNDYSREYNINFAGRNDVTETVPATRPNANREYSERSGTSYQNSNRQRSTSQSRDKYRERDQERDRPKERDRDRERRDYRLGRNERRDEYVEQRSHKRSRSRSREKTHSKRYDQRDSKDSGHRSRERDSKGSHGYKVNDRDHYDNHRSYSRDRDRDSRYH